MDKISLFREIYLDDDHKKHIRFKKQKWHDTEYITIDIDFYDNEIYQSDLNLKLTLSMDDFYILRDEMNEVNSLC